MTTVNQLSDPAAKPRVGIFGLTGCAGDQLQILNCEDELLHLIERIEIVDWVMAKSENDHEGALDIAFVEGVVATERDLDALRQIRGRATTLIAIGTCAVWGGLPAMKNAIDRDVLARIYERGVCLSLRLRLGEKGRHRHGVHQRHECIHCGTVAECFV